MKDYLVKTKAGEDALRSECMRLKGEYYLLNNEVFKVFDVAIMEYVWLFRDDKNLLYNIDTKKWVHHNKRSKYVMLNLNRRETSDSFDCNSREAIIDGRAAIISKEYGDKNLKFNSKSGMYYNDDTYIPKARNSILYQGSHYGYEGHKDKFKKWKETKTHKLDNLLFGHSYGVELETSSGYLPSNVLLDTGVCAVRDGSTPNYEYVTKPYTKIGSLLPVIDSINENCEFDISTSLHIHIGNVPTSKEYIAAFYRFAYAMQDQIFNMFPKYKADNVLNIKRRNYTKKLPNKIRFSTILNFLNNGNTWGGSEYTGKHLHHPADIDRRRKWQISSRYHWLNLVPLVFYPARTIEFRIHQGTFNKYKIIYWLLICNAMIKYVEMTGLHEELPIGDMLSKVYSEGNVAQALITHYQDMCTYYMNYDEINDLGYIRDISTDKSYEPKIKLF